MSVTQGLKLETKGRIMIMEMIQCVMKRYNNNKLFKSYPHIQCRSKSCFLLTITRWYLFYVKIQYFFVVIGYLWYYASIENAFMINYRGNLDTSLTKMTPRRENQFVVACLIDALIWYGCLWPERLSTLGE